jgi:DNA-binding CsgD family transcriptional regulator
VNVDVSDLALHQRLGHLLSGIGSPRFWPSLAAFLNDAVPLDSWVSMVFRSGAPPVVLHQGHNNHAHHGLFSRYVRELYVLDPFYLFAQSFERPGAPMAGLYRLNEVAPECFRDTEYFRHYFAQMVAADEVQFLLRLENHGVLSLSLGRRSLFSEAELGRLCLYQPWILPLMRLGALAEDHQELHADAQSAYLPRAQISLEQRLRHRGTPKLTDREVQTALLLLAGHSSKGIAHEMGISPDTVKVHRRHLYEKLGVASQAGLFGLFMAGTDAQTRDVAEAEAMEGMRIARP